MNPSGGLSARIFKFNKKTFLLDQKFYWLIENRDGSTGAIMSFIEEKKGMFFDFIVRRIGRNR